MFKETKFLGYTIFTEGIRMDPDRVKTIIEWPAHTDLQVFLGLANFYRPLVEGYSRIILPLTAMLCKSSKFNWGDEA